MLLEQTLTESIPLRAINETWQVRFLATTNKQIRLLTSPASEQTLTIYSAIENISLINTCLKKWLKQKALTHLIPWLNTLSMQFELPFNKGTVRLQRTLWGSCSQEKNISLNAKLLFLPEEYARHVLIHELCHTKYLNHSQHFWKLLNKLDPNTRSYDKLLLKSDHYVPGAFSS